MLTVDKISQRGNNGWFDFQSRFKGQLIRPEDTEYEEARKVWNGMIDRHPSVIARCTSVEDVVKSIHFARDHEMRVSIRGGGHNVAGHATNDGGLVIDLAPINHVDIDTDANIVRVGGGATIGQLDAETQKQGLAVPMGVVSATGVAGLTLGGGYGFLRNKHGLSCDSLVGATVVTADGQIVHASQSVNSDLLWGLRGGGGNFGVVVEFIYQLYPVGPEVMLVFTFHDGRGERMKKAMQFYRDFSATAPDEISTIMACGMVPPDEHFPEELHRVPFVLYAGMYAGATDEGKAALQPLVDFGDPLLDFSGVMPYVEAQQMFDEDYPNGLRYYWKSLNLTNLNDEVIDTIISYARRQPSPFSTIDIWHVGGAVKRTDAAKSAFFGRDAAFMLGGEANWVDPVDDEANLTWLRGLIADAEPFSDGSRYLNFAGFQEEGEQMMKKSFGPHYARLAELKRKYDPDNFFCLNQNVKPRQH